MSHTTKKRGQASETFVLGAILALSGGLQDAYTYNIRDQVFANAQTGNVVLASQNLALGNWGAVPHYLFPIFAFALGVVVAEWVQHLYKYSRRIHWRQIVVLLEIAILFLVGFMPQRLNTLAAVLVSFTCSMQVQTFRKVHGYAYASTMCIGNLRSGMESLSVFVRTRQPELLRKTLHYWGIILFFAAGAALGGLVSPALDIRAIWCSCLLLLAAWLFMLRKPDI